MSAVFVTSVSLIAGCLRFLRRLVVRKRISCIADYIVCTVQIATPVFCIF
jgi:hypothetical protein